MDEQTFLLLATRKLTGEAHDEDLQALQKYLDTDEALRKKYELLKEYWEQKNVIQTNTGSAFQKVLQQIRQAEDESGQKAPVGYTVKKKGTVAFLFRISAAAVLLVACFISAYYIFSSKNKSRPVANQNSNKILWQVKETPKAAKSAFTLPDGTRVVMNADSRLEFPAVFKGTTREVFLKGEAYFDVRHDEAVPFIIHTSKMNIKVLGTEFNVRSYPEDSVSETTLIRGLIEVTLNGRPSDKIILRPKEKLTVSNESAQNTITSAKASQIPADTRLVISKLHYVSPADSAIVETSWLDNKLVFQNKSFSELSVDLERRYGVTIEFSNAQVKTFRFTGIFEKENIDQVLNALSLTEKFNYKKEKNRIIIY